MTRQLWVSRRSVLGTVGTVSFGTSVYEPAKLTQDRFSRFEIQTSAQARNVQYEFTTDGPVYAFTYPSAIAAEPGGNDTVKKQADETFRVRGRTGEGESDTWLVDGQLLTFETDAAGQSYTLVWNGEEIPPPSPGNRFEIQTASQASNLQYEFLTDGPVEAITQPPDIRAEPDGNDAVTQRVNGVYHVSGLAGGGYSDTWRIDGEVTWFNTTASQREYSLLWNGEEIPPPESSYNRFEIRAAPQARNIQYDFITDGVVEPVTLPDSVAGEPTGNDTIEPRNNGTYRVTGRTGEGKSDTWLVDGQLLSFDATVAEGDYTLLWNGTERPPSEVGNGDGDGAPQIEFLDCSKFRIVGDFEAVLVEWGGYAEGAGRGDLPIDVGPVSGETVIGYMDVWPSHDIDRSDYFQFSAVHAYTEAPETGYPEGEPDLHKEHPTEEDCRKSIRPTQPELEIEAITRTGPDTYDVTFGYTNPNEIVVRGKDEFASGNARGSPPAKLQQGHHTFMVTWQPQRDDERLRWEFVPLGYFNTGVTVSVATPPHAEVRQQWTPTEEPTTSTRKPTTTTEKPDTTTTTTSETTTTTTTETPTTTTTETPTTTTTETPSPTTETTTTPPAKNGKAEQTTIAERVLGWFLQR